VVGGSVSEVRKNLRGNGTRMVAGGKEGGEKGYGGLRERLNVSQSVAVEKGSRTSSGTRYGIPEYLVSWERGGAVKREGLGEKETL